MASNPEGDNQANLRRREPRTGLPAGSCGQKGSVGAAALPWALLGGGLIHHWAALRHGQVPRKPPSFMLWRKVPRGKGENLLLLRFSNVTLPLPESSQEAQSRRRTDISEKPAPCPKPTASKPAAKTPNLANSHLLSPDPSSARVRVWPQIFPSRPQVA